MTYRAVPCACGHQACKNWHVSPVADVQGVSFTKEQAELIARTLNKQRQDVDTKFTNPYAVDGLCHNANHGSHGQECGKPAAWLGVSDDRFAMGFCDECKQKGDEAKTVTTWIAR